MARGKVMTTVVASPLSCAVAPCSSSWPFTVIRTVLPGMWVGDGGTAGDAADSGMPFAPAGSLGVEAGRPQAVSTPAPTTIARTDRIALMTVPASEAGAPEGKGWRGPRR